MKIEKKIERKDIVLVVLGAMFGFLVIYSQTSDLLAGSLGIPAGALGGCLGSLLLRWMTRLG